MTGERLAWYRVASHLHIPVAELAERISFREFLDWLEFLSWWESHHDKDDYYLAQIAAEVRRSYVKHPKTVKTKDFLLGLKPTKPVAQGSKQVWLSIFNLRPPE